MSKPNIYLAFTAGLFYLIYYYDMQMKLFLHEDFLKRRKQIGLFEGLSEVHVLEGKHITCISVHELVCVFHLFKQPFSRQKMLGSPMDSLKGGACIWGKAVVLGEGELLPFLCVRLIKQYSLIAIF